MHLSYMQTASAYRPGFLCQTAFGVHNPLSFFIPTGDSGCMASQIFRTISVRRIHGIPDFRDYISTAYTWHPGFSGLYQYGLYMASRIFMTIPVQCTHGIPNFRDYTSTAYTWHPKFSGLYQYGIYMPVTKIQPIEGWHFILFSLFT